eukprot:1820083-Prymnesium_polylepis.1
MRLLAARLVITGSLGAGVLASMLHRPSVLCQDARMAAPAMCAPGYRLIDGKAIAGQIRREIKEQTAELLGEHGVQPGLAVVLVGDRTDSSTYVRMKKRAADEVGFHSVDCKYPESVTEAELLECVRTLNADPKVHGILVQLPLPRHINEAKVLEEIKVEKDVDGFSAENIGNMCLRGGKCADRRARARTHANIHADMSGAEPCCRFACSPRHTQSRAPCVARPRAQAAARAAVHAGGLRRASAAIQGRG